MHDMIQSLEKILYPSRPGKTELFSSLSSFSLRFSLSLTTHPSTHHAWKATRTVKRKKGRCGGKARKGWELFLKLKKKTKLFLYNLQVIMNILVSERGETGFVKQEVGIRQKDNYFHCSLHLSSFEQRNSTDRSFPLWLQYQALVMSTGGFFFQRFSVLCQRDSRVQLGQWL